MEKKMMILLHIKIYAFILLSWTYHSENDISIFKMSEFDNYQIEKKIDTSTYRILAKYKQDKDSCDVYLQEYIPKYESNKKRYISNNEEKTPETKKQSNGSASVNEGGHKQHVLVVFFGKITAARQIRAARTVRRKPATAPLLL
ncbi:hypothetical protein MKS88_003486 [Plasmodium brasilianum]|uniref:Uncharacterized protein n=1 Tax=Plasmodium brasilianum TaxID=5824 RepID=A0ACB9Y5K0_PLABR|nr:hypothetical protein MKS88_003486 [Plasmodium brasilianum]